MPTRDRARYLQPALERLLQADLFPFPIEIIVSDNHSSDDTPRLVRDLIDAGAPIRYFRHRENIGAFANMLSAYRRADGEFAIYVADDDALIATRLAEAVASLRAAPHVVAQFGPLQTYDVVEQQVQFVTHQLPHDLEFAAGDRLALLDLLLEHHIVPEVPLLRARCLGDSVFRSTNIYWAYAMIDRLLEAGSIRFTNTPFYRAIARHWEGENRITVGTQANVGEWEAYHRGLEYFYWRARLASPPLTRARDTEFRCRIAERRIYFLGGAFRSRLRLGDFTSALEIAQLLAAHDPAALDPGVAASIAAASDAANRHLLRMFGAADLTLEVLDHLDELGAIGVFGFETAEPVVQLLRHRRPDVRIEVMSDVSDSRFKTGFLLIAADAFCRELLIARGIPQGRVINFKRLLSFTSIPDDDPSVRQSPDGP
jgi:glycosyltransferase involved in cell wall biosynthesis